MHYSTVSTSEVELKSCQSQSLQCYFFLPSTLALSSSSLAVAECRPLLFWFVFIIALSYQVLSFFSLFLFPFHSLKKVCLPPSSIFRNSFIVTLNAVYTVISLSSAQYVVMATCWFFSVISNLNNIYIQTKITLLGGPPDGRCVQKTEENVSINYWHIIY